MHHEMGMKVRTNYAQITDELNSQNMDKPALSLVALDVYREALAGGIKNNLGGRPVKEYEYFERTWQGTWPRTWPSLRKPADSIYA